MPAKSAAQKRFMDAAAHNPAFAKKAGVPTSVAKDFSEASKGMKFRKSDSRPEQQGLNKPKTNHGSQALFARGGEMKESKAMEMRHAAAMKKAGVPKKFVREEMAEASAMKRGGGVKKMAVGGNTGMPAAPAGMPSQANFGGGMTGLDRAAAMSGRTMPAPSGAPAMPVRPPMPVQAQVPAQMPALPAAADGRVAMKKGGTVKKMAMGGVPGKPATTGLARAAQMSGRTMPTTGKPDAMKKGGKASCYARGGGIEVKGKTRGRMV